MLNILHHSLGPMHLPFFPKFHPKLSNGSDAAAEMRTCNKSDNVTRVTVLSGTKQAFGPNSHNPFVLH